MDLSGILTGGGSASLILAGGYAWRQYQTSRAEKRAEPQQARSTAVADAATANALILAALKEEREETGRLSGRIEELETQNALLYQRMRDQRREYETELADLRRQLKEVSDRLGVMQDRLRVELPPDPEPS